MIGKGRMGTAVIGGGVRDNAVDVTAELAEASASADSPFAYNGLVRARTALARGQAYQVTVRIRSFQANTMLKQQPSSTKKMWNGKAWVPVNELTWGRNRAWQWDGTRWVEVPQGWNGRSWGP